VPTPSFIRDLRQKIGTTLLLLPTVAVITYDDQGRMLLVRHAANAPWTAPGGIVEPSQTPSDAAVRETWEETGVLVELVRLLGVFGGDQCATQYPNGDRIAWVATLFEARPLEGSPQPDGEEVVEARYFDPAEVAALPLRPHMRMFLDAARSAMPGGFFQSPTWRPPHQRPIA
jgi:ADP-ribose pyrophosphatase YjhB (NUDIX family)